YDIPRVLPVDAVDLPAALQGRTGGEEGGAGALVPLLQHRAGERAGDRRGVRAVRDSGGAAQPLAVVLPHQRLRRPAAGEPVLDRLVGDDAKGAGELDRAERGGAAALPAGARAGGGGPPR